jgi:hypothetical protein
VANSAASFEKNQTKSNGRGGKRANAGRKTGSATKKTREIADRAAEDGITPLEVMLKTMRALVEKAERVASDGQEEGERIVSPLQLLVEASAVAKDAAPYVHPRLSSIDMKAAVTTHEASLDELG